MPAPDGARDATQFDAAISPDGRRVAWVETRINVVFGGSDFRRYVADAGGRNPRQVAANGGRPFVAWFDASTIVREGPPAGAPPVAPITACACRIRRPRRTASAGESSRATRPGTCATRACRPTGGSSWRPPTRRRTATTSRSTTRARSSSSTQPLARSCAGSPRARATADRCSRPTGAPWRSSGAAASGAFRWPAGRRRGRASWAPAGLGPLADAPCAAGPRNVSAGGLGARRRSAWPGGADRRIGSLPRRGAAGNGALVTRSLRAVDFGRLLRRLPGR